MTVIVEPCSRPGLITTRSPVSTRMPAPSAPRIRGFGTEGSPLRTQRSRWFKDAARRETRTSPGPGVGSGTSSYRRTSGPPSSWMRIACMGRISSCKWVSSPVQAPSSVSTRSERRSPSPTTRPSATSANGAPGASSPTCASRWLVRRISCHPETLLPGAKTVVSAALCYYATGPELGPGEGRLSRYTWSDRYAELREKLDELGRRLGAALPRPRRREPARRPRGGGALGRRLLRQEHAADHAAPRLVGRARHARHRRRARAHGAARRRLRVVHALHRRLPDRRARRAGRARLDALPLVLDAGAGAGAGCVPRAARRVRLRLRHLPGRLSVEPRRREAARGRAGLRPVPSRPSRSSSGSRPTETSSSSATTASTCPATTRATCAATPSSLPATSVAKREAAAVRRHARG